nr:G protein-coupled receptor [Proales similis]
MNNFFDSLFNYKSNLARTVMWIFILSSLIAESLLINCPQDKHECKLSIWTDQIGDTMINCNQSSRIDLFISGEIRLPLSEHLVPLVNNCRISNLVLVNFDSFDIGWSGNEYLRALQLKIYFSDFKFSLYQNTDESEQKEQKLFKYWSKVSLGPGVNFNSPTPAVVFNNATIKTLEFDRMFDTLNRKQLIQITESNIEQNTTIHKAYFNFFNVKLDSSIISKQIFSKTNSLYISSHLKSISANCFTELVNMNRIIFSVFSLKYLFHENSAWLRSLNSNVSVNYSAGRDEVMRQKALLLELRTTHFFNRPNLKNNAYDFPDEDFCLFRHFPFEQYVFPVLHVSTCSCTRAWLTRFFFFFELDSHMLCWNDRFCDFDRMLARCDQPGKIQNWSMPIDIYYVDDQYWHFRTANFVLSMWVTPAVSLVGLVANLLSVATLRNSNFRKNMKQRMFDQMLANSVIDATVCLIGALGPLSLCIDVNSNFCMLAVVSSKPLRIFFIVLNQYVSGVLRTWSNCVHIMLSLDRFNLSTDSNHKLLAKFAEIKQHKLLLASLGYSILVNVIKLFEFEFDIEIANLKFPLLWPEFFFFRTCYSYLNLIFVILNNILLITVQFGVDFALFLYLRRKLQERARTLLCHSTASSGRVLAEKSKEKIKRMLIINSVVVVLLHLPEIVVLVHLGSLIGHSGDVIIPDTFDFVYLETIGPVFMEAANTIYSLCYTFNIFFYFKFNKTFRDSFRSLFVCSQ